MKLQISFDNPSLEESLDIASKVAPFADIIEVGTIPLYRYGTTIITKFKEVCNSTPLLADTKLSDRGSNAVAIFAEVGTKWLTVMAGTSNSVIYTTCTKAQEKDMHVMMDLLDAPSPGQSAMEAKNMGIEALLLHESYEDTDPLVFMDTWENVRENTDLPIFISAKINRDNVTQIISLEPDGIVVGESITEASDPAKEAEFFADLCKKH